MKYRIKIITYKDGGKQYFAEVKEGFMWAGIFGDASTSLSFGGESTDRKDALNRIDLHFSGHNKVQTIEFEYINK